MRGAMAGSSPGVPPRAGLWCERVPSDSEARHAQTRHVHPTGGGPSRRAIGLGLALLVLSGLFAAANPARAQSTDATLSNLYVSFWEIALSNNSDEYNDVVSLSPAFDPETTEYSATPPNLYDSINFLADPEATSANATIRWILPNGNRVDNTPDMIFLRAGQATTFQIEVTAEDGVTVKTYTFTINRAPPLRGWFEGLPDSHDGSTAFQVRFRFAQDIASPIGNVRAAISAQNATVSSISRVSGNSQLYRMTVTPSSAAPLRIQIRGADTLGLGWRLEVAGHEDFGVRVEGSRLGAANDDAGPEHRVGLRLTVRW